jgi:hypothetical protein
MRFGGWREKFVRADRFLGEIAATCTFGSTGVMSRFFRSETGKFIRQFSLPRSLSV